MTDNKADKSIIIIGAGLAGLSAGVFAQMNGYRSHIFEHHRKPGGVAACWKRDGYLIDGGIHFLMGHRPGQSIYELYQELGTVQANAFIDMPLYGRFVRQADGTTVELGSDLDQVAAELKSLSPDSPEDARLVDRLIRAAKAMQGYDMGEAGMGVAPELMGPVGMVRMLWSMRRAMRYIVGRYAKPVSEFAQQTRSPLLRQVLENLFLPEVPVWFVLMLLSLLADKQMGLLEGGTKDFVEAIEKRYLDLGGQVTYWATVQEILVEGDRKAGDRGTRGRTASDRAVGVRLADGAEHRADVVISAADGRSTIFEMLGGRYVDQRIEDRYKNWKLFRPMVAVSFGIAREFAGEPWMTLLQPTDPFEVGGRPIDLITVRIFNYSDKFAPSGKTVVQVGFETEWEFWNDLRRDRPRYDAEKERVATAVLARLEELYPGVTALVEVTDVATPYTTWRYTRNWKGSYEGWLPAVGVLTSPIPKTLPGLANLYMAGQWVTPGGGVPPCLYSGRQAIQILCKHDGKPFAHHAD